jgi:hypothetical protein
MTIFELGAIGEFVGAFAILITLAYLAIQVRYARIATQDKNRESRVTGIIQINSRLANNRDLRQAYDKAASEDWKNMLLSFASIWGVSVEEASAVVWTHGDYIWLHWAQYRSLKTNEDQRELENLVKTWYSAPPMSTMIQNNTNRAFYDPEFISWIDLMLTDKDDT